MVYILMIKKELITDSLRENCRVIEQYHTVNYGGVTAEEVIVVCMCRKTRDYYFIIIIIPDMEGY